MHKTQFNHARFALLPLRRILITRVLTIYQVKLTQSTALEQKRFDILSLSPALPKLRLLLVIVVRRVVSQVGLIRLLETLRWRFFRHFPLTANVK